jgi:hypothetical protein
VLPPCACWPEGLMGMVEMQAWAVNEVDSSAAVQVLLTCDLVKHRPVIASYAAEVH